MLHRLMKWFHNLKVAQKLALISFVFVLPDSIMLYLFITSINETITFARLEQVGNEYQRPLERLLELTPQQRLDARRTPDNRAICANFRGEQHRSTRRLMSSRTLTGELAGRSVSRPKVWPSDRGRGATSPAFARMGKTESRDQLDAALSRKGAIKRYLTLIDHIRAMIAHAGDMSNLILDPDLDTYYLMDATLMALPQTQDRLSRVMGDGEDFFAAKGDAVSARHPGDRLAFLKADDLDRNSSSVETALTSGNPLYGSHT